MGALHTTLVLQLLVFHQADPSSVADKSVRDPFGAITFRGEPEREWTDFLNNKVQGRLRAMYGATIFMSVEGQEDTSVPLVFFSKADREYVKSRVQASKKPFWYPGSTDPRSETTKLRLTPSQWSSQIKTWVREAESLKPDELEKAEQAWNCLRHITDPNAVEALKGVATRETNLSVRTACIESLARISDEEAKQVLVKLSVSDASGPVRAAAAFGQTILTNPDGLLAEYAAYLRSDRTRESALLCLETAGLVKRRTENQALDQEFTESLIGTLIVKQHRFVPFYKWTGYDTGWFKKPLGKGVHRSWHFSAQRGIKRVDVPVPCEMALSMLVRYSGQNFGYDRQAWRNWQAENAGDQAVGIAR